MIIKTCNKRVVSLAPNTNRTRAFADSKILTHPGLRTRALAFVARGANNLQKTPARLMAASLYHSNYCVTSVPSSSPAINGSSLARGVVATSQYASG
jgi:hypothetical protein